MDTGDDQDGKLKSKDFFDVQNNPLITFHSTKVEQTRPRHGGLLMASFTRISGVTRQEKLTFLISGKGTGAGTIKGAMAFNHKQYGMNSNIPFIKVPKRVEVTVNLIGKRVSGPTIIFKTIATGSTTLQSGQHFILHFPNVTLIFRAVLRIPNAFTGQPSLSCGQSRTQLGF